MWRRGTRAKPRASLGCCAIAIRRSATRFAGRRSPAGVTTTAPTKGGDPHRLHQPVRTRPVRPGAAGRLHLGAHRQAGPSAPLTALDSSGGATPARLPGIDTAAGFYSSLHRHLVSSTSLLGRPFGSVVASVVGLNTASVWVFL